VPHLSDLQGVPVAVVSLVGTVVAITVLSAVVATERQRRRQTASMHAIEFVRGSFTGRMVRGDPIDVLLREVLEALRSFLKLDRAEFWVMDSETLRLQFADPPAGTRAVAITDELKPVLVNAPVSGTAWADTWLPDLIAATSETECLRLAPVSHAGELLGLLVISRVRRRTRLAEEADELLGELARDVGVGLYRGRLDATLQATLEQLRQQAAQLQASRARLVAASDSERKRIERDLHDGAQHYLLSISVKARLIERITAAEPERARHLLEELVQEAEAAIEELRALGHGIYPPLLSSSGLDDALAAACRRLSPPAEMDADSVGRFPADVESAVYFCCVEALQNSAKHAGRDARPSLLLRRNENRLYFEVRDSGRGFEVSDLEGGGLANMRDRLGAAGGTLVIESRPGKGTIVRGEVPCSPDSGAKGSSDAKAKALDS
jgi:signal transduction histidine kinase